MRDSFVHSAAQVFLDWQEARPIDEEELGSGLQLVMQGEELYEENVCRSFAADVWAAAGL